MSSRLLGIILPLLLFGCDAFYGAQSHSMFSEPVDVKCVNAALASVPGVGRVAYQRSEDQSTEIFPKQRKVLTVSHVWAYGEDGGDILQINQTPDGWEYWNSRTRMNVPVPHDEIVRFLPLMHQVNNAVESRCSLPVAKLKGEPAGLTRSDEL